MKSKSKGIEYIALLQLLIPLIQTLIEILAKKHQQNKDELVNDVAKALLNKESK